VIPYPRAIFLQCTESKGQHPAGGESVAEVCKAELRSTCRKRGSNEAVQIILLFLHSHSFDVASYHFLSEMPLESDLCFQKEPDNKDK